jgi:tRNA uridine 5-carboxymethylaminomethyl modification enzyme
MIDDLITLGTIEPYRMFTSRSEYRLSLRADNADLRLTPIGIDIGIVLDERKRVFNEKYDNLQNSRKTLESLRLTTSELLKHNILVSQDGSYKTAFNLLGLPNFGINNVTKLFPEIADIDKKILEQLYIESKYSSYLSRQKADIELLKKEENHLIPKEINYFDIAGLSKEVKEKLSKHKPHTIGNAKRISGITPAAITAIILHIRNK